jgi:FAD/FMN-containing dehydrogenase
MSDSALTTLSKGFRGDIVTPSDPDYVESIARWAINAVRKAKIVAFVKDSEDVSLALKFARDNKLPLAIKGGGHSTSGASSSEDGLVIDLSRHVNGVKIDAENKLGYVGGGAVWGDLDKASIEHGLAGVAGMVNDTGVGGYVEIVKTVIGNRNIYGIM